MRYVFDESKLDAVIRAAYDLSRPQGMGYLHFQEGPLPDDVLTQIKATAHSRIVASMDYVRGRAVKQGVYRSDDGLLYIEADRWFDHSIDDLRELAKRAELGEPVEVAEAE